MMRCVKGNSTGCSYDEEMRSAEILSAELEKVREDCGDVLAEESREEERCAVIPRPCHMEQAVACVSNFTAHAGPGTDWSEHCL